MTRLGELPAGLKAGAAPAHYARPLGGRVLITNDAGDWALLSPAEYAAFARGAAPPPLARRLADRGFSLPPNLERSAEKLFPRSALAWRGPARVVLILERDGRVMDLETVEAAVDFAFACGPDAPHLVLAAGDARLCWPAVWLAVQRALRRGEWTRRPARLELRARRLPEGRAAEELSGCGVLRRLVFDLNGAPPGPKERAQAALALVGPKARRPEAWVDWLRAAGFDSYRLQLPDEADLEEARAFADFHGRAVTRLLDGVDRSDLVDETLADYLRAQPLSLPGLDVLGELAVDRDGGLFTSERALRLSEEQGRGFFHLGEIRTARFGDLASHHAAVAALEAADADRQPLCAQCAFRPFCRVAPARHFARFGTVWGRLPESPDCAAAAAFLDRIFPEMSNEKAIIFLKKANIDSV